MSFFYILFLVKRMKVYVDLIIFLNFYLDFLLLITTSITLKRNSSLKRILFGTIVGSISIFFLFFNVGNFLLFFLKLAIAILMVIGTFGYKNLKYTLNNLGYFYMISVILGGFLYYLNLEFSYTHIGFIFINKGISINAIFLILISPLILYVYYRQAKKMKATYNLVYQVVISLKNKKILNLKGFLDTGNKLIDPITNKPILLIQKGIVDEVKENIYFIPFHSLGNHNLLKCFKPEYIEIENKRYNNYLIGISDKKFSMEGVECILNNRILEDLK